MGRAADRRAITDLIHAYCRAVDRIDERLGHTIFHPDGTADYGEPGYPENGRAVIDLICAQHRGCVAHSHQINNIRIDLAGDRAASEAYVFATVRMMVEGRLMQVTVWGRYLDRWSRREGRWGIDHRLVLRDLDSIAEAQPMSACDRARRDRDDPSYALLPPQRD